MPPAPHLHETLAPRTAAAEPASPGVHTLAEILALTEPEKYALEIYHRYDDEANRRKLLGLYGRVVREQDRLIGSCIRGRTVLDVGSGYGVTSRNLLDAGFEVTSIDPCAEMRQYAKEWHGVDVVDQDVHQTTFPDASFDTVVVRESVEHLVCEAAFREMDRIERGEIVIFQTNLCLPVRAARALLGHEEFNPRALDYYRRLLLSLGYGRQRVVFRDVIALPLSGGMVAPQRFPAGATLQRALVATDQAAAAVLRALGLGRLLCWRFVLHATRS